MPHTEPHPLQTLARGITPLRFFPADRLDRPIDRRPAPNDRNLHPRPVQLQIVRVPRKLLIRNVRPDQLKTVKGTPRNLK